MKSEKETIYDYAAALKLLAFKEELECTLSLAAEENWNHLQLPMKGCIPVQTSDGIFMILQVACPGNCFPDSCHNGYRVLFFRLLALSHLLHTPYIYKE